MCNSVRNGTARLTWKSATKITRSVPVRGPRRQRPPEHEHFEHRSVKLSPRNHARIDCLHEGPRQGAHPDWGAMIWEYRLFVFDHPRLVALPCLAIALAAWCFARIGDPART